MVLPMESVLVEVFTADMRLLLRIVKEHNIRLWQVEVVDELTLRAWMHPQDYSRLQMLRGVQQVKVLRKVGWIYHIRSAFCHPVLAAFLLLCTALTVLLPSRILFIQVSGNETVPTNYIVQQAQLCGIGFGASRKNVRSEQVKNELLGRIPQLKWAAVTTDGCTATIHVAEEKILEDTPRFSVGNIVASCDGIIRSATAVRGTLLCRTGDVVTAGQTLISGYTDCGIRLLATQAQGEIYADTRHHVRAAAMKPVLLRGEVSQIQTRYTLRLGKKLIKLYKGSGISDRDCVRIYAEKSVNLPGGHFLPVALIREQIVHCADSADSADFCAYSPDWVRESAAEYLRSRMLAGSILEGSYTTRYEHDTVYLDCRFRCDEMIGVIKSEEKMQHDGKID